MLDQPSDHFPTLTLGWVRSLRSDPSVAMAQSVNWASSGTHWTSMNGVGEPCLRSRPEMRTPCGDDSKPVHRQLSVQKAGHHVDHKGNDDRAKQIRERGMGQGDPADCF